MALYELLFSSVLLVSICVETYAYNNVMRFLNMRTESNAWFNNGLKFSCTACGKCCQMDGEVWMDMDEMVLTSEHLNISHQLFLNQYTDTIMSGWVKLKNKVNTDGTDRCIFLDEADGRSCTIYKSRPVQCRTYPYWPRLLTDESSWSGEAVVPDDTEGPHWNAKDGGCEGINHKDAVLVSPLKAIQNMNWYESYMATFPNLKTGDDRSRFETKASIVKAIIRSTKAWISNFVIHYNLCPFAKSVFQDNSVRYAVFFGTDPSKIRERLKYEILTLLATPESELATTILVLPFAFPAFLDFHHFGLELEDVWVPAFERDSSGSAASSVSGSNSRLAQRVARAATPLPEIQLACFHPAFQWAGEDLQVDDPINFEKRSPFPVINLLRAARVRQWANELRTADIGAANEDSLSKAGPERLRQELDAFVRLAVDEEET